MERTLLIIKPNVRFLKAMKIRELLEEKGFTQVAYAMHQPLKKEIFENFYAVHKGSSFFEEHIAFMCSGCVHLLVLEAEGAVARLREFVGATDPKKAAPGTLRSMFGNGLPDNAVHASDSVANAEREISYFFSGYQLGQVLD